MAGCAHTRCEVAGHLSPPLGGGALPPCIEFVRVVFAMYDTVGQRGARARGARGRAVDRRRGGVERTAPFVCVASEVGGGSNHATTDGTPPLPRKKRCRPPRERWRREQAANAAESRPTRTVHTHKARWAEEKGAVVGRRRREKKSQPARSAAAEVEPSRLSRRGGCRGEGRSHPPPGHGPTTGPPVRRRERARLPRQQYTVSTLAAPLEPCMPSTAGQAHVGGITHTWRAARRACTRSAGRGSSSRSSIRSSGPPKVGPTAWSDARVGRMVRARRVWAPT